MSAEAEKLAALYRQLDEVNARLALEDTDFTINRHGSEPVAEDHEIDAHAHAEELAGQRAGPERLHVRRQELVEQIDAIRLGG